MFARWEPTTLALCAAIVCHGGARAQAPPPLPPLQQPATQEHHPGKMIAHLLVTPDLAATKQFYGGLFGWTFQDINLGQSVYSQALLGGQAVAGFVGRPVPGSTSRQPAWLTMISTEDVAATETAAAQAGAKILFGPRDIPGLGQEAILTDKQGAVFGMLTSNSGDPADKLVPPGAWIWSVLFAPNPDVEAEFYQNLFHYDVFALPGRQDAEHLILATEDFARASVNPLPHSQINEQAYWLSFVRVADAVAAAARATDLGGRVLVQPRLDRHGSKIAVLADPSGAAFGVMEWPEPTAAGVAK